MGGSGSLVFARVGLRFMPGRLAGLRRRLGHLPVRGRELGLARARDTVADVGGMRMERDLYAGAAMEVEHADPRVLEQHREVVRRYLDRILRPDRARREQQNKSEARRYHPWGHVGLLRRVMW